MGQNVRQAQSGSHGAQSDPCNQKNFPKIYFKLVVEGKKYLLVKKKLCVEGENSPEKIKLLQSVGRLPGFT